MNAAQRWHLVSELFDQFVDLPRTRRKKALDDSHMARMCGRKSSVCWMPTRPPAGWINPLPGKPALFLEKQHDEFLGRRFRPYQIKRLLAQGGMGRVFLAERVDGDFSQNVALKLLSGHGSFDAYTARRRFLEERQILARLQHPYIACLLDGGLGPEAQPWFAMEYVDGAP